MCGYGGVSIGKCVVFVVTCVGYMADTTCIMLYDNSL